MPRLLDKQKAFKQFQMAWIKGGLIGGAIGALPGLFALIMSWLGLPALFGAYIGNFESSSVLIYLGFIAGGSSGVIVGSIVAGTHLVIDAVLQAEDSAIEEAARIPLPGRK